MAKITKSGAKVYNAVRSMMTTSEQEIMPLANDTNIAMISDIMLNASYKPMLNNFINTLINRIGLTIVRNKAFNNPLSIFKKGAIPLGTDIQDIYTNPAKAENYEFNDNEMGKLLKITDPDTKVAYYRLNRKNKYPVTISRQLLANAFTSWDKFNDMITSITNSLYSGNYIDEYNLTKKLVSEAYKQNKVVTSIMTRPTDKATGEDFLIELKNLYDLMQLPSSKYNSYSKFDNTSGAITTWTSPERIAIIMRADVVNQVSVKTLAGVFNLTEAEIQGRLYKVDKFDDDRILGVVCDEAWLQIYDNLFQFDEFYNASVMAWNEFLHVWQTYAICPFANAVCLCTEEIKVNLTDFSIGAGEETINVTNVNDSKTFEITVNPANAKNYNFSASVSSVPVGLERTDIDAEIIDKHFLKLTFKKVPASNSTIRIDVTDSITSKKNTLNLVVNQTE